MCTKLNNICCYVYEVKFFKMCNNVLKCKKNVWNDY